MRLNFFYVAIDTINQIKMQPMECEKMFENNNHCDLISKYI